MTTLMMPMTTTMMVITICIRMIQKLIHTSGTTEGEGKIQGRGEGWQRGGCGVRRVAKEIKAHREEDGKNEGGIQRGVKRVVQEEPYSMGGRCLVLHMADKCPETCTELSNDIDYSMWNEINKFLRAMHWAKVI